MSSLHLPGPLVLASASPRRRDILKRLGFDPLVMPTHVDEESDQTDLIAVATGIAGRKAAAARQMCLDAGVGLALIVAADTCVAVDEEILGKPKDPEDARRMLALLSGRTHTVVTGLSLVFQEEVHTVFETTEVTFRPLAPELISAYIATGEPFDKAGAYGIQEKGAALVDRIDGCYFNVAGLPVARLCNLLDELGLPLWRAWA